MGWEKKHNTHTHTQKTPPLTLSQEKLAVFIYVFRFSHTFIVFFCRVVFVFACAPNPSPRYDDFSV